MPTATVLRTKSAGFTFIEVLVTTILIGVLATIVVVSFVTSSEFTRDSRRKRELANVQAALEAYKLQVGQYPDSDGCGGSVTWPGCTTDWIPGLVPLYLSELPVDPKQNYSGAIGNLDTETYTYNYTRLTANSYHLLTRLENDSDAAINGSNFGYSGSNIYVVIQPQ